MSAPSPRPAPSLVALTALVVVGVLGLAGCSSGSAAKLPPEAATPTPTASPSASSTVAVPTGVELTDQGSRLSFGDPARVVFETTDSRGSVLELTVQGVRRARRSDFAGFILDDTYKKTASYYYARVRVHNVGQGDVGGVGVPLWGVNARGTLLPAVNFTTAFKPCASRPLPASFPTNATLTTCLVYLSPSRGTLEGISYRPSQQYDPISWNGTIAPPAPVPKPARKGRPRPRAH